VIRNVHGKIEKRWKELLRQTATSVR